MIQTLADLPEDILISNLFPYLTAKAFMRLGTTCVLYHVVASQRNAPFWRAKLADFVLVPERVVGLMSLDDGIDWKHVYCEWDIWTRGLARALGDQSAVEELRVLKAKNMPPEALLSRRYIMAVCPKYVQPELFTVHFSRPSTLIGCDNGALTTVDITEPSSPWKDGGGGLSRITGLLQPSCPVALESDTMPVEAIAVREWDAFDEGTDSWALSVWRKEEEEFARCSRFACIHDISGVETYCKHAKTHGSFLACYIGNQVRVRVVKHEPQILWERSWEDGLTVNRLALSERFCACSVGNIDGLYVEIFDLRTGARLAKVGDMPALRDDEICRPFCNGILSIHVLSSYTLLVETVDNLLFYALLPLPRYILVRPLVSTPTSLVSNNFTSLVIHPSPVSPMLVFLYEHTDRMLLIRPREQQRTAFFGPNRHKPSTNRNRRRERLKGVWIIFDQDEKLGVLWKSLSHLV
ncbi:hypothetical protein DFS34DRAFT_648481 [Phlyctochytrium arcticum]|nr:hypothetical protein DFS34DRAFT_648481 [Phlyctochytrium arcticum]